MIAMFDVNTTIFEWNFSICTTNFIRNFYCWLINCLTSLMKIKFMIWKKNSSLNLNWLWIIWIILSHWKHFIERFKQLIIVIDVFRMTTIKIEFSRLFSNFRIISRHFEFEKTKNILRNWSSITSIQSKKKFTKMS